MAPDPPLVGGTGTNGKYRRSVEALARPQA